MGRLALGDWHGKVIWVLAVEPHVAIRVKRLFPRVHQGSSGEIVIHHTDEVARDLLWILDRYKLDIEPSFLRELKRASRRHLDKETMLARMLSGMQQPRPFELALPPRQYQKVAADITLSTTGLLLADDVGLGKTVSALCVLTDPKARPALVVTLAALPKQWERELNRFCPELRVHILKKGTVYDLCEPRVRKGKHKAKKKLPKEPFPDVILSTYHKLHGWSDHLKSLVQTVIFDEVQELRTGTHVAGVAVRKTVAAHYIAQHTRYRMGLTATPIYNMGSEIWHVLEALRPGAMGTFAEFTREWCEEGGKVRDPKGLGAYLRREGLMLRRTRADVHRELPGLTVVPHHIESDPKALEAVEHRAAELARIILSETPLEKGAQFRAAEELSARVRQATGVAKAPYVAEFVKLLVESGERVVLYGWHRQVYDLWLHHLAEYEPAMFTGSESPKAKQDNLRRFYEHETPVIIVSLRAGAGVDGLQHHSRTCVFGELDWSPGVHEQCEGRIFRDGQPDPVVSYYLLCDSGSDPIVADVLGVKKEQVRGLRDPAGALIEKLDVDPDRIKSLARAYLAKRRA